MPRNAPVSVELGLSKPGVAANFRYLIALGSNQRHPVFGRPELVLNAAFNAIQSDALTILARSTTIRSKPVGPSHRRYANAAAILETTLEPLALLKHLKRLEAQFGRRNSGQIWRARVLDLDIILWSGGIWADPNLVVPHRLFRQRDFVLIPCAEIAPNWRDPVTGLFVRHLKVRLDRATRQS
jgi:2-amino-4-hydroxy-6-hydroxymethyldihydropteridine diphosphokinase